MTPLKTMCAAAAMVPLLASFALRSELPLTVAHAENRFDTTWTAMTELRKSDREALPVAAQPAFPVAAAPVQADPIVRIDHPPPVVRVAAAAL